MSQTRFPRPLSGTKSPGANNNTSSSSSAAATAAAAINTCTVAAGAVADWIVVAAREEDLSILRRARTVIYTGAAVRRAVPTAAVAAVGVEGGEPLGSRSRG